MRKFKNRERKAVERFLTKSLIPLLNKNSVSFELKVEYKTPKRDLFAGRIDVYLVLPQLKKEFGIEYKHSLSVWTKKEIESQVKRYNRVFSQRKNFKGVFLVSDNGKYGLSEKQIIKHIKEVII